MNHFFDYPYAVAIITGNDKTNNVRGRVKFYQRPEGVLVTANIKGLPENTSGFYGFHIHEGTSCKGTDFSESGNHYNPENTLHPNHAGDLPPLLRCGNIAHLNVLTDRFNISDIIGKTVIIHDQPDDFNTQPSGNAGTKTACGIIKRI